MNTCAVKVIYKYEMLRARETLLQSLVSPVVSTALYFVVFGSAIGSRIEQIDGVSYGTFIVPGLIMLALLTQSRALATHRSEYSFPSSTAPYTRSCPPQYQ